MPARFVSLCLPALLATASTATAAPKQTFKGAQGRYEMCMKRHIVDLRKNPKHKIVPMSEVASAKKACRKLAPRDGEDVVMSIMECGVEPGDASPDMGCE